MGVVRSTSLAVCERRSVEEIVLQGRRESVDFLRLRGIREGVEYRR